MIEKSKCNKNDDSEALKAVYMELTKPEMLMHKEDGKEAEEWPWMGKTFDHSPLVAAIASLTSMQAEILSARATALAHIKGKVSTGEFSFNSIEGLATGPAFATSGEDIELKIMMAAFDSDNQPVITGGGGAVTVANGQGTMKMKASGGGEMNISGTVKIRKKSGDWAEKPWKHTVKIVQAQGVISLPQLRVLYRDGYDNIVEVAAAGYPEADLQTPDGVKKLSGKAGGKGKQFVVRVTKPGKTCMLSVIGYNPVTKKRANLGSHEFLIQPLPKPQVFFNKGNPKLFVRYADGIPLKAQFTVQSWELTISGSAKQIKGNGQTLSPEAINFLGQAKPGSTAFFKAKYTSGVMQGQAGGFTQL
jgi:gliding motility-associated protein GldM